MYVTEEVGSVDQVGLYPVNALRNKALQLSQTEVRGGGRGQGMGSWRKSESTVPGLNAGRLLQPRLLDIEPQHAHPLVC